MIKNYLLLALKVLRRKPFYTFISLFGISFTLMILMLITSMGDAMFGANQPMTEVDRMVFLPQLERYTEFFDTTYVVDTIMMNDGTTRLDSAQRVEPNGNRNNSNGPMSYSFLDKNLRGLTDVENYTFLSNNAFIDAYLDGRKVTLATYYVDANYWKVFDYKFLYGLPFGMDDLQQANKVVVITERAAANYFGEVSAAVIDREMQLGAEKYRVVGIVQRPLKNDETIAGDVYLPLTTIDPRQYANEELQGPFQAVFLASSSRKRESVMKQLAFFAENFEMPPGADYEHIKLTSGTAMDAFAASTMQTNDTAQAKLMLFIPLLTLLALFLTLPLINLINLNVSRVFERKSEIAVRKAFGADSRDILFQFLFENLVLTVIGGLIGFLMALLIIKYTNENELIGTVRLAFSLKVFIYFIIVILLFGLLSGILPAYRMSRTTIGTALR